MKTCILNGVPLSLRQDGWWLGPTTRAGAKPDRSRAMQTPRRYALHALLLAGLMAVTQLPGLSVEAETAMDFTVCGRSGDFGFHAAPGLRSLPALSQQGVPL